MAQVTYHPIPQSPLVWAGWLFCALWMTGCALHAPFRGDLDYKPSLISGERLFDEPLASNELPRVSIAEPSEAMREYVETTVGTTRQMSSRFMKLFAGLSEDGYFEAVYSANTTRTAAETFESKGGNCLAYTNMFIALARLADLNASYQIVDTPASWDADSGFIIRYTHINVLLRGVHLDDQPGNADGVIVDFNDIRPDVDYRRRVVSDEYAESLFYANKSVNLLRTNQVRESFAYLRRALEVAPENVDLWINLGAFYATQGDFDSAIEAYQVALQIDPRHKPAYSGLARSYSNKGDFEQAAYYEERVRNYRVRNPYYHYALAQAAFEEAEFEESLEYINTAIGLKRRIPRFHLFKGLVELQLGESEAAESSFLKAQRYGLDRNVKLDMLRTMATVTSSS